MTLEKLKIDGKDYRGIIDTGADISLIAKRHSPKFVHKVSSCKLMLRGILAGSITIDQEFKAILEISDVVTDLVFHVVPDYILEHDVIIGRNMYNDPEQSTITDLTGTRVVRNKIPRVFRISDITNTLVDSINVSDEYRHDILKLLSRFPKLLPVNGYLPEVNNARFQINLKDDFVVNRNPYRLPVSERNCTRHC